MSDLTRYRRLPGYSTVGTDETLPPGSYSSAVADFVPDSTLQAIADAVEGYAFQHGGLSGAIYACEKAEAHYVLIPVEKWDDALEGTDK